MGHWVGVHLVNPRLDAARTQWISAMHCVSSPAFVRAAGNCAVAWHYTRAPVEQRASYTPPWWLPHFHLGDVNGALQESVWRWLVPPCAHWLLNMQQLSPLTQPQRSISLTRAPSSTLKKQMCRHTPIFLTYACTPHPPSRYGSWPGACWRCFSWTSCPETCGRGRTARWSLGTWSCPGTRGTWGWWGSTPPTGTLWAWPPWSRWAPRSQLSVDH